MIFLCLDRSGDGRRKACIVVSQSEKSRAGAEAGQGRAGKAGQGKSQKLSGNDQKSERKSA